jgi:N-acetylneuraminic acid mutarotase
MNLKLLSISFLLIQFSLFSQWEERASTPFTKDHGIGFSLNGYGYVLTGGANGQVFSATKDFFKYDPVTNTWEQLPDYPGPDRGYGIGDVWNGKLYFGFGTDGFSLLNDLWEWDPSTNTFTQLPSCPCLARVHPAFVATNGKVYVGAGGAAGNLNDWWVYDIASQNWTQRTNIPETRHHPYQFAINGDVYVGNGHRTSWYRFNDASNTWTQVASLGTRVAGAQFSFNGKGYALSGTDNDHNRFSTGEFWEYDPVADTWTALPPHPGNSRFGPTQFVIDDYIYIAGGYNRFDPTNTMIPLTTMWRYNLSPSTADIEAGEVVEEPTVFPNPTNSLLNIVMPQELSGSATIQIYNLSGQLILDLPYTQQIDISDMIEGIYVMNVVDEGISVLKKKISKL